MTEIQLWQADIEREIRRATLCAVLDKCAGRAQIKEHVAPKFYIANLANFWRVGPERAMWRVATVARSESWLRLESGNSTFSVSIGRAAKEVLAAADFWRKQGYSDTEWRAIKAVDLNAHLDAIFSGVAA